MGCAVDEGPLRGSGFVRIAQVKLCNEFLHVPKFIRGEPREFFIGVLVAEPSNVVLKFYFSSTVDFRVYNFSYFKFVVAIDFNGRRRGLNAIRDCVRRLGFKHGDMEYGVDPAEIFRETDSERRGSGLVNDFERTEEFLREFVRGARGTEEFGLHEDFFANLEVRRGGAATISWSLITGLRLGHRGTQLLVKLVEVGYEVSRAGRGEVEVGIKGEVGVIAFVREERGYSSGNTRSVVERELGEGQEVSPVILLIIAINT